MIVFFLPNLQIGGAERVMVNLLLSYKEKYPLSEMILLLGEKKGDFLDEIPDSIPIHTLDRKRGLTAILPFIKFCSKYQPDIILSTLGASVTTSMAKGFISKDITIINRIGNTIGAEKLLYVNPLKRRAYIFANQLIAKFSDHLIFQCDYMARDYIKETGVTPASYSVIYNPVKVNKIREKAAEDISVEFNLVAVGRLQAQKDYSSLLRACADLKSKKRLPFKIAILGEGNLRKRLETEINDLGLSQEVKLLGYVKNPYPYIKHADYLVSSSLYEGFSNVIIEALCLGTPVIATDCPGGNAEVLKDFNGYLCKVGDAEDIAQTISKALSERNKFSRNLIAKEAQAKYAEKVILNAYDKVISKK